MKKQMLGTKQELNPANNSTNNATPPMQIRNPVCTSSNPEFMHHAKKMYDNSGSPKGYSRSMASRRDASNAIAGAWAWKADACM